mmetsp:Transcript_36924/g.102545  ORF Transcript_36924/g.102545 Transcript_36924/m.102545 type:complete len:253 (+) Transcript_36924:23-781(+)
MPKYCCCMVSAAGRSHLLSTRLGGEPSMCPEWFLINNTVDLVPWSVPLCPLLGEAIRRVRELLLQPDGPSRGLQRPGPGVQQQHGPQHAGEVPDLVVAGGVEGQHGALTPDPDLRSDSQAAVRAWRLQADVEPRRRGLRVLRVRLDVRARQQNRVAAERSPQRLRQLRSRRRRCTVGLQAPAEEVRAEEQPAIDDLVVLAPRQKVLRALCPQYLELSLELLGHAIDLIDNVLELAQPVKAARPMQLGQLAPL